VLVSLTIEESKQVATQIATQISGPRPHKFGNDSWPSCRWSAHSMDAGPRDRPPTAGRPLPHTDGNTSLWRIDLWRRDIGNCADGCTSGAMATTGPVAAGRRHGWWAAARVHSTGCASRWRFVARADETVFNAMVDIVRSSCRHRQWRAQRGVIGTRRVDAWSTGHPRRRSFTEKKAIKAPTDRSSALPHYWFASLPAS